MRVLLVAPEDSRAVLRQAIGRTGLAVVSEAASPDQAAALAEALGPEIALVSLAGTQEADLAALEAVARLGTYVVGVGPALEASALMRLMRAGVRDYLEAGAAVEPALERAVRAFALPAPSRGTGPLAPPPEPAEEAPLSVAVFGPRGGCGQSTIAANLAIALFQATSRQAVLVDLALQYGDADLLLNVSPSKSSADLLPVLHDLDPRALEQTLTPSPLGVKLLAAPEGLEEAEAVAGAPLTRAWETLGAMRLPVVFDAGSELTPVVVGALEHAAAILVPIPAELGALRKSVKALRQLTALGIDREKVRFLAYDGDPGELKETDAVAALGAPIHARLPWAPELARQAIDQGVPVLVAQPNGAYAQAMRELACTLAGRPLPAPARPGLRVPEWLTAALGALRRRKDVPLLTAGSP